jgi:hypothetical protein
VSIEVTVSVEGAASIEVIVSAINLEDTLFIYSTQLYAQNCD